jgi:hypothetical protein
MSTMIFQNWILIAKVIKTVEKRSLFNYISYLLHFLITLKTKKCAYNIIYITRISLEIKGLIYIVDNDE